MKRIIILYLFVLIIPAVLFAGNRSEKEMKRITGSVLQGANNANARTRNGVNDDLEVLQTYPNLTIIGNESIGFAVIANDEKVDPILGFSDSPLQKEQPDGFTWWIEATNASLSNPTSSTTHRIHASFPSSVEPLCNVLWGQGAPFKNKCPGVAGCVAVAMATIMYTHQYPIHGIGSKTYSTTTSNGNQTLSADFEHTYYDWDHMRPSYPSGQYSEEEAAAVAELIYQCGVAVNMKYSSSSSTAYTSAIAYALMNYFNYQSDIRDLYKSNYSSDEWMDIVYTELTEGRPIIYRGASTTLGDGHAFIVDGYNNEGLVHIRWGWKGGMDGYYDLSYLVIPLTGDSYNMAQEMICHIVPKDVYSMNMSFAGNGSVLYLDNEYRKTTKTSRLMADESVILRFVPDEGNVLGSVVVNNVDVTDQVSDNTLILDPVNASLDVKVAFEDTRTFMTLKTNDKGAVKIPVQQDREYSYQIIARGGSQFQRLTFNGVDVTNKLDEENVFTTPTITDDSRLEAFFKIRDSISWSMPEITSYRVTERIPLSASTLSGFAVSYTSSNDCVILEKGEDNVWYAICIKEGDVVITASAGATDEYLEAVPKQMHLHIDSYVIDCEKENNYFYITKNDFDYSGSVPNVSYSSDYKVSYTAEGLSSETGTHTVPLDVTITNGQWTIMQTFNYTYNIHPLTLTVKVVDAEREYGSINPSFEITYNGFVKGEDESVLLSLPQASCKATSTSPVDAYTITVTGGEATNYTFAYEEGKLIIHPAIVSIIVEDVTRYYGDSNPTFNFVCSGLKNNESNRVFTEQPVLTTKATKSSPIGDYVISATGATALNYVFEYTEGTLTIEPSVITISVQDAKRKYGEQNPTFQVLYSGFKNGEKTNVLQALAETSTIATIESNAGTYPITASGARANNYTFNYVPGTLTIEKADQTITWEQDLHGVVEGTQLELTATSSSGLPVSYVVGSQYTNLLYQSGDKYFFDCISPDVVTIRAIQNGNENYNAAERVTQTLHIVSTGIETAQKDVEGAIYDLSGRRLETMQKGINIIRYSDGSCRKVLMK